MMYFVRLVLKICSEYFINVDSGVFNFKNYYDIVFKM